MRFAFVGDTHGNLKLMYQTLLDWQAKNGTAVDFVFQIGDFGFYPTYEEMDPSGKSWCERHGRTPAEAEGDYPSLARGEWEIPIPTYFIRGNHEAQGLLCRREKIHMQRHPDNFRDLAIEINPNLYYIPDGHLIDVQGVKLAAWGGCWSWKTFPMDYWSAQRHHLHTSKKKYGDRPWAKRLEHMTHDIFESLMQQEFDVLLTHDAPTGCGLRGSKDQFIDKVTFSENHPDGTGVRQVRELIMETTPLYHFCGHWHQFRDNRIGVTHSIVLDQISPDHDTGNSFRILDL